MQKSTHTTLDVAPIAEINPYLLKILSREAELVSRQYAFGLDRYILLHVKKKPRFFPTTLYHWLIGKLLVRTEFCVPNPMNFILEQQPRISDDISK